jgi:acyl-CoA synthetase (NDP forming)
MKTTPTCHTPETVVEQLRYLFNPRSLAVIGASSAPFKWGHRMLIRPLNSGFRGSIYAVNQKGETIAGLPVFRSINAIPGPVDLAVITVPAAAVPDTLNACADKGVVAAVVISAGFAETGETGRRLQEAIVKISHDRGLRVVGPNCMGIWSAEARLNLSFGKPPRLGSIAFISQSGTFGAYLSEIADDKGYGLSKFVSIGNQADLKAADYLAYLAQDADTRVIVFYMEGFKDGRRFMDLARRVVPSKPIVVFKAGRTEAGSRASFSHTASLAGADAVFDDVCRQIGLIRAQEALQSFEIAEALATQPPAPGRRIAILGSGGQGVVSADACMMLGLEVPELNTDIVRHIQRILPPHAPRPTNPVDFAGSARTALKEARVVETLLQQDMIDGVITNVPINPLVWSYEHSPGRIQKPVLDMTKLAIEGTEHLASLPGRYHKPVITLRFFRFANDIIADILNGSGIPIYDTPEECARAMAALSRYGEIRRRSPVD